RPVRRRGFPQRLLLQTPMHWPCAAGGPPRAGPRIICCGAARATINSRCARVTVATVIARLQIPQQGYELWDLCHDHLLFHQSHSAGSFFLLPCHAGTKCKGGRMSIPIPDEKMDDYARDCVERLASRVDDRRLRERLLQMAREWKAAAIKEIGYR